MLDVVVPSVCSFSHLLWPFSKQQPLQESLGQQFAEKIKVKIFKSLQKQQ
jgi:hypothetical protein